jgi:hypothetical protein
MPTRKQRRRREKTFRHEYGFVTTDEEGNEVELPGAELRAKKTTEAKPKPAAAAATKGKRNRVVRDPEPASWRRSLRRGLLWSPATVIIAYIVFRTASVPLRIGLGLAYGVMIIPMTYWIDGLVYRRFERKKVAPPRGRGR